MNGEKIEATNYKTLANFGICGITVRIWIELNWIDDDDDRLIPFHYWRSWRREVDSKFLLFQPGRRDPLSTEMLMATADRGLLHSDGFDFK